MKFLVWVVLELPPVVHVVEVDDDAQASRFAVVVMDLDHVRPAAVDALQARLIAELASYGRRLGDAVDEDEWLDARAGIQLVELYAIYAVHDDGNTLHLDESAAAVFLAGGIDPLLWGWTIRRQGGDAAAE